MVFVRIKIESICRLASLIKVGNRSVYFKGILLLIFLLSGISSKALVFGKVVLTPISKANMTTLSVSPAVSTQIPLHHFDISCSACHKYNQSTDITTANTSLKDIGEVDVNRSCSSFNCHSYDRDMNHPVDVTSDLALSLKMPLDKNGRITCLTCHLQPESETAIPRENAINERMLQTIKDGQLCGTCHTSSIGQAGNQVHWQFSQKAHLGKINRSSDELFDDFSFAGSIDEESQTCITCHDDITITIPGLYETPAQKKMRYMSMKDHPIGMEYSKIVARDARRYINSHAISNKVRLFDGKVGCGSCHSLYSDQKSFLVVEHTESELCRKCHIR